MPSEIPLIEYDFCATPFGECLVARTARGLCRIEFTDDDRDSSLARLRSTHSTARFQRVDLAALADQIFNAESGEALPVDAAGTEFQQQVWAALRQLPRGATCSYADLAAAIGRPRAARAVGRAVGSNPVAVLVPCHRVLPAAGGGGGYRWGPGRKLALLEWEALTA